MRVLQCARAARSTRSALRSARFAASSPAPAGSPLRWRTLARSPWAKEGPCFAPTLSTKRIICYSLTGAGFPGTSHNDVTPAEMSSVEVPSLSFDLERVLFGKGISSSGIHTVRDMRNPSIYLFDEFLGRIHQPEEIAFDALPPFTTSSKDENLHELASEHSCKYKASTSSISGIMGQLYLLLSNFKDLRLEGLSKTFENQPRNVAPSACKPIAIMLRPLDGAYAIDSDNSPYRPTNRILMDLGKSLERMVTMDAEEFRRTVLKESNPEQCDRPQPYHFSKMGPFALRSQLDCYHPRIRRPFKTFDIKTRATAPIRLDCDNYKDYLDYGLRRLSGWSESYEREFYDMARTCFLKYSLQLRIGNMDGAFVCYHNTQQMFGFEYITLQDIERIVYGSTALAEKSFEVNSKLLAKLFDRITDDHANETLRVSAFANKALQALEVYVETVSADKGWSESASSSSYLEPSEPLHLDRDTRARKYTLNVRCRVDDVKVVYAIEDHGVVPVDEYEAFLRRAYSFDRDVEKKYWRRIEVGEARNEPAPSS